MPQENIIQKKSYAFALRILSLHQHLNELKHFDIARQVLRSGTSVRANIEESIGGQSSKDFFSKVSIAYKEARETKYWLSLLKDSKILKKSLADSLLQDCEELLKIMGKIKSSLKNS